MKWEGLRDLSAFEALYKELLMRYEEIRYGISSPGKQVVLEQYLEKTIPDFINDMKQYELGDKSYFITIFLKKLGEMEEAVLLYEKL